VSDPCAAARLQAFLQASPFIRFLGLRLEHADTQAAELAISMPMRAELARGGEAAQFHGGAVASLIDTAGDFALIQLVNRPVPTVNFRVDYLRPCTGSYLRADAKVRRSGKSVGVVDIDVVDDHNRLCAVGRGCYGMSQG
jgi:uncharacterized protein (TIGR00369 family)